MPRRKMELVKLSDRELASRRGLVKAKKVRAKLPKRAHSGSQLRAARKKWLKAQKPPTAPRPKEVKIKGVRLKAKHVDSICAIHESTSPTAEFVGRKFTHDGFMGELYSSMATFEYSKLQGEYRRRKAKARTAAARAKVDAQWAEVVKSGGKAFKAVGVKGVGQRDLDLFSKELRKSRANYNTLATMASKARAVPRSASTGLPAMKAAFLPQVAVLPHWQDVIIPIAKDLCEEPLLDGKYTKYISESFSLEVRIRVWCPTWTKPWRTCMKTFTIAGASFSVGLEVGYEVTCCGAKAWGSVAAEACVTVVGVKVCASCTARVTAVAGIDRSGSGSKCTYGLGAVAELKCTLAGVTVFTASVPFGWTLIGPCPPKVLPC